MPAMSCLSTSKMCLVLVLLGMSLGSVYCTVYYVVPEDNIFLCDHDLQLPVCMTLQQYAQDAASYASYFTSGSNSTFIFFEGNHILDISVIVEYIDTLTLIADSFPAQTVINCEANASLTFANISSIVLEGLQFVGCGEENAYQPALHFISIETLHLTHLRVCHSPGGDVRGHNVHNMTISNCTFGTLPIVTSRKAKFVHHLQLIFNDSGDTANASNEARVLNSTFYNSDRGAIHIDINNPSQPAIVYIDQVTTIGAFRVGQVLGVAYRASVLVDMNSALNDHTLQITNSQFLDGLSRAFIFVMHSNATVFIQNCTIKGSKGGAVALYVAHYNLSSLKFVIADSEISDNSLYGDAGAGSALLVEPLQELQFIESEIELRNVTFANNVHIDTLGVVQSTVYLADVANVTVSNCTFHSNQATAILTARGRIHMTGNVEFFNNTGYQGGGCALYGYSRIVIAQDNTRVNFTKNQAINVGGAIFVRENFVPYTQPLPNPCFFRIEDDIQNVSFLFVNNTAMNGGNAIYGESIENCSGGMGVVCNDSGQVTEEEVLIPWPVLALDSLATCVFSFEPYISEDISAISSAPSRVCVCENGMPNCTVAYKYNISVVPGQAITLPLVTVGHAFGAASGSVFATFLLTEDGHTYHIEEGDRTQATSALECRDISFTIASSARNATVVLTSQNITVPYFDQSLLKTAIQNFSRSRLFQRVLLSYPLYVNISFLDCPLGSSFNQTSYTCTCDPNLTANDVQCDIAEGTVTLPGGLWVNASYNSSGDLTGIIAQQCELQYCIPVRNKISLQTPDAQCAFNRSRILCGGCREGLSLTLGPPTCRECSNHFLSLLCVFALSGILLVFFIKLLNLTVSVGTINGLIFYANIVWANRSLFFITGETSFPLVFIAWLNLDLGILICFYDGMDMYALTWLQYAFPIYICFLALLIAVLAHYSSRMAKLLGSNSVPVLATLFLLIYNKLLRNIINTINLTELTLPDNSTKLVWRYDGNYDYVGSLHVYLFAIAVLLLVFAWLPFTATLLFGQYLLRLPHNRLSGYLRPFLDAYYGPLQDNRRSWVGLLLLLRCAILLVAALNPRNTAAVDLLVIFLAAVLLLYILAQWGPVYRSKNIGQLETSFIFNLAVLSGVQMYALAAGQGKKVATQISVIIVFLEFVLVLLFHGYRQIRNFNVVKRFETKVKKYLVCISVKTDSPVAVVGTITLSDSLQIESMSPNEAAANEEAPPPTSDLGDPPARRRLLTAIRARSAARRSTRGQKPHPTHYSSTTVTPPMVDSMETDMSQVRMYMIMYDHNLSIYLLHHFVLQFPFMFCAVTRGIAG